MKKNNYELFAKKYSVNNLNRLKKVLEIVTESLELQDINRLTGNKIPSIKFHNRGLSSTEATEVLRVLQVNFKLFEIQNEEEYIVIKRHTLETEVELRKLLDAINSRLLRKGRQPKNWGWSDRNKGVYQFGKTTFVQGGTTRRKVFVVLMDTFEKTKEAISVATLREKTGVKPNLIRIEINAINKRLGPKAGYYFKGSGRGYYTLEKLPQTPK